MSTQLLVNVFRVPAVGDLAIGDSVTIPHGLIVNDVDVAPTLIQPDRGSAIVVTVVTDTEVTFTNNGAAPDFAYFRCERGLSTELDADAIEPSYWQGVTVSGGGSVAGVTASAPVTSSGGAVPNIALTTGTDFAVNGGGALVLSTTGVTAAAYGNLAAANQSVVPTFTVDAKGRLTLASSGNIQIGGTDAKTYVDNAQAAAEAFAQSLAFQIGSKQPAHVATTAALPLCTPDVTYQVLTANANGALPQIDSQTVLAGERILVKNQADARQNGLYVLTQVGTPDPGGTPWILTRTADANTPQEICGALVTIETGTVNANTAWLFSANPNVFVFGNPVTGLVNWTSLAVPNAQTGSPGIVQLAGGLGGSGTTYTAPLLDVGAGNVTAGTLQPDHGGTGIALTNNPADAGKVLTAVGNGTWTLSDVPPASISHVYFVTLAGDTLANGADGSITNPFDNINDAVTKATLDLGLAAPAQIIVAPGTYAANVALTRFNTFVQGAGARPEDQPTRILGTVTISPTGGALYNDQVSIDGCFIQSSTNAPAVAINSGPFTVTISRSYLTTNNTGASAHALRCSGASKVVCQNNIFTVQGVTAAPVISISAGDVRFSEGQIQNYSGTGPLLAVSGASSVFVDRGLMETLANGNAVTAVGTAFVTPTGPLPYKLLIANSSLTGAGATTAGVLANAGALASFVLNTVFQIPAAQAIITATSPVVYGDIVCAPTYSTTISGVGAVAYNEVHGEIYIPALAASSIVLTDSNKKLVTAASLATNRGGTGTTSNGTQYGVVYYDTTTSMASSAAGTTTTVLHGNASGAPSFGVVTGSDFGSFLISDANKVLATPNGSVGTPSFRSLVAADLPSVPYDVAGSVAGKPAAGAEVFWFKATRAFTLSNTATNHKFSARTASSANGFVFTLYRNTVVAGSAILTATFDTSATGTVAIQNAGANNSISIDDTLILVAPASQDTALADIFWTLSAIVA